MRAWLVHVVFASILVGTLAAKHRTTDALVDDRNLEAAVIRVAASGGLAVRQHTTLTGTDILSLVFDAAGCSQPVLIAPLSVTFDQDTAVQSAREPDYVLRYVYIERSWEAPHRMAAFVERMKYAALAVFGFTSFVPSSHLLLVQSPAHCRAADSVDWSSVWRRAPVEFP